MKNINKDSLNLMMSIIYCVSLFFSFTNLVPLSICYVLYVFFIPFIFFKIRNYHAIQKVLVVIYLYFVLSCLFYDSSALLNYNFYRRDGNFFVTYLPLLLLPYSEIKIDVKKIVSYFLIIESVVNGICYINYLSGHQNLIFSKYSILNPELYHFLFVAHNAAGGYIGCVLSIAMAFFICEHGNKKIKYLICVIINFITLIATDSRGTIFAIIFAIVFLGLSRVGITIKKFNIYMDEIVFVIMLLGSIALAIYIYICWGNNSFNTHVQDILQNELFGKFGFAQRRTGEMYIRLLKLWPTAIAFFLASPIIGCGFGSYNDSLALHEYVKGIFSWNYPEQYIYSDGHAHQSFLNILAETGVVGLVLILILLWCIRKSIFLIKDKAVSVGLYLALVVNVMSSFTEHRIFTPSQMIPFVLILSITLASRENLISNIEEENDNG